MRPLTLLAALALPLATACPGPGATKRSYPEPTAEQITTRLAQARARARSFQAQSTMDYWLGKDRVKGTVLVMGTPGAKVRFNALNPAGESVLADLACDGAGFVYVDVQKNCQLTGPCNADSLAALLGVPLAPDDFFYLALGQAPVLDGATGTVTWDSKLGRELVTLTSPAGTQQLVLDGKDGRWDVLRSELKDPAGKLVWAVEHTDFAETQTADGQALRVPGKSRFRSPDDKADLLVEWEERRINVELGDDKFQLTPPAGLPSCR